MTFRIKAAVALMLCAAVVPVHARMDERDFPYHKQLTVGDGLVGEVGSFWLDNDMYASTDTRYANVRLIDENGAEIPYLLRKSFHDVTEVVESSMSSEILSFKQDGPTHATVLVRKARNAGSPKAFIIRTKSRNFEKEVSVFGSYDAATWELLTEKVEIFDYSRFINVRNVRVPIPENDFEYFRVDISQFVEEKVSGTTEVTTETRGDLTFSEVARRTLRQESIRIDGVDLFQAKEVSKPKEPVRKAYTGSELRKESNDERQVDTWTFDSDRQPIVSMSLQTPSRNFSRRAVIEGAMRVEEPKWVRLADQTVQSFDLGNLTKRQLTMPLNREARYEQYRVTVYNQDNASIALDGVVATGHVYEVVFLPARQARYEVLYGGEGIQPPQYDVGSVIRSIASVETSVYGLTSEEENPSYKPGKRSSALPAKVIFIVAMAGMIGLLVWLIAKGAGKVEMLGDEGDG